MTLLVFYQGIKFYAHEFIHTHCAPEHARTEGPPARTPARAKNTPRAFLRARSCACVRVCMRMHAACMPLALFTGGITLPPDICIFSNIFIIVASRFPESHEVIIPQTLLQLIFCQKLLSLLKNLIPSMGHIFPHRKVFLRSLNFPL